eukprot:GFKZ01010555.1.p1 GENE.GFKZ01010555.1~~GFKZ01010555.1.p1  ORF type:complete len:613 (-),score=110.92 GFKZ01010555.1:520-2358(-)
MAAQQDEIPNTPAPATTVDLQQPPYIPTTKAVSTTPSSPLSNQGQQHGPDDHRPDELPQTPRSRLYLMVLADFGLAFTWLCKFAIATPYFQHTLKAGAFLSHLVWIMGPLSGLIVAPLVGVLSDRCTSSFGRRRPFIFFGTLACILGMNLFSFAPQITLNYLPAARLLAFFAFGVLDFATNAIMFPSRALMGDLLPAYEQHAVQSAAAVVASLAEICAGVYLWSWKDPVTNVHKVFAMASIVLAVTCSVSLWVCREEPLGPQGLVSRGEREIEMRPLGQALDDEDGGGVGVAGEDNEGDQAGLKAANRNSNSSDGVTESTDVDLRDKEKGVEEEGEEEEEMGEDEEDIENRLSSAVANDDDTEEGRDGSESGDRAEGTPREARRGEGSGRTGGSFENQTVWSELKDSLRGAIVNFPRPLVRVGVVYGLAWFVWFASLPFYSNWLGAEVLDGDPNAEAGSAAAMEYQRGVTVFSVANVAKAGMAMVFSAFYPRILMCVGAVGERVVFGAAFIGFGWVLWALAYTKNVLVAGGVIALGAVPFIATQTIPIAIVVQRFPERLASNLGVMNLFCVGAQLIDTLYTGKVAQLAGESAVLRVAAAWAMAAGVAAVFLL